MTVVNIHARPERVWFASDTLLFRGNRPAGLRAKFDLLPEIQAVMGCRGAVRLHLRAREAVEAATLVSIEALAARLAEAMPGCFLEEREDYQRSCAELGCQPQEMIVEVWAVGWSPACDCFRVVRLFSEAGFAVEWLGPGSYINPGFRKAAPSDCPDPVKAMVASAVLQERLFRKAVAEGHGDLIAIGGELQLVEMTRHAMRISTPYRWPDYEELKAEIHAHG